MTSKHRRRRENALERLNAQLKTGVKPVVVDPMYKTTTDKVALTDSDKKRINKEIETLEKSLQ